MVFPNDLFREVFEGDPLGRRGLFEAQLPQNIVAQQRQQLSALYEPTFNKYLGNLVQNPSLQFTDFLSNDFNPQRERGRLPGLNTGTTLFNL